MEDKFDALSENQKNEVMNFLQITGTEDVNTAITYLEMAEFDTSYSSEQNAVNLYFQFQDGGRPAQAQQRLIPEQRRQNQPPPPPQRNQSRNQRQQQQDALSQLVKEYKIHLQRKEIESQQGGVLDSIKNAVKKSLGGASYLYNKLVPVMIRGETPGGEEFIYRIRKQFGDKFNTFDFQNGTLQDNFNKADEKKFPLLVFIYIEGNSANAELIKDILSDPQIKTFINKNFQVLGLLARSEEAKTLQPFVASSHFPCFIFFRKTLFDKIESQRILDITSENPTTEYYLQNIQAVKEQYYMLMSEDDKVKNALKSRNDQIIQQREQFFAEHLYNIPPPQEEIPQRSQQEIFAQQAQIEEDRLLRQAQEEAFREAERQAEEQQMLKQIEEQRKKEEQQKAEQEQNLKVANREKKRALIPQEPEKSHQDAFTFAFRVPDGTRVMRRFLKTHSIQLLFDFIECQEDIEFESEDRKFDLVQTFPPLSLLQHLNQTIKEVFPDSVQEIIIVKEL